MSKFVGPISQAAIDVGSSAKKKAVCAVGLLQVGLKALFFQQRYLVESVQQEVLKGRVTPERRDRLLKAIGIDSVSYYIGIAFNSSSNLLRCDFTPRYACPIWYSHYLARSHSLDLRGTLFWCSFGCYVRLPNLHRVYSRSTLGASTCQSR